MYSKNVCKQKNRWYVLVGANIQYLQRNFVVFLNTSYMCTEYWLNEVFEIEKSCFQYKRPKFMLFTIQWKSREKKK